MHYIGRSTCAFRDAKFLLEYVQLVWLCHLADHIRSVYYEVFYLVLLYNFLYIRHLAFQFFGFSVLYDAQPRGVAYKKLETVALSTVILILYYVFN